MQTSFLKDLVTAVNPTSPWSFLAYLVAQKRFTFLRILNAEFEAVPRREFAQYLAWVAARLPSLASAPRSAKSISRDGPSASTATGGPHAPPQPRSRGRAAAEPSRLCGEARPRATTSIAPRPPSPSDRIAGKRVAVIGGGQSGAEIVLNLLNRDSDAPAALHPGSAGARTSSRSMRRRSRTSCSRPATSRASTLCRRRGAAPRWDARSLRATASRPPPCGRSISASTCSDISPRNASTRPAAPPHGARCRSGWRLPPHHAQRSFDGASRSPTPTSSSWPRATATRCRRAWIRYARAPHPRRGWPARDRRGLLRILGRSRGPPPLRPQRRPRQPRHCRTATQPHGMAQRCHRQRLGRAPGLRNCSTGAALDLVHHPS